MALKDRTIQLNNNGYNPSYILMDGDVKICDINYNGTPTSNCQVSGLFDGDLLYKMPDNTIIKLFSEIRTRTGKRQMLTPISDKRSIKRIDKLISEKKIKAKITNDSSFGKIYLIYHGI